MSDTTSNQVPAGFTEVTKERFFALLNLSAAVDPMPCLDAPGHTTWETQKGGRQVWGWSVPGWRDNRSSPKRYAVRSDARGVA